jgi:hypothetical protein
VARNQQTVATRLPKISRRCLTGDENKPRDQKLIRFPSIRSPALAWASVTALCGWLFAGMLDGAGPAEVFGVPMLLALWALALFLIDRWVKGRLNRPSRAQAPRNRHSH